MKLIFNTTLITIIFLLLTQLEGVIQQPIAAENQLISNEINLSAEEKQWLRMHPVITVAVNQGWAPIAFVSKSKEFRGVTVDYLKTIERMLSIRFELVPNNEDFPIEKADIISSLSNPNALINTRYSALSKPYITSPYAIYTKREINDIKNLSDLNGKKITMYKSGSLARIIANEYPEIVINKADAAAESLNNLESNKVDAYIGNALVVNYVSAQEGYSDIKSSGNTNYSSTIYMGVRRDWPTLISILDKSFNAIDEVEHERILSAWRPNIISPYLNNGAIVDIGIGLFLLIILITFWNQRLKKEVFIQKAIQADLSEALNEIKHQKITLNDNENRLKELALIAEITTNPIVIIDRYGIIKWVNNAFIVTSGFQAEFAIGKKCGSFLHGAETSQETVSIIQQAIENHEDFSVEILNYTASGEKYWTNIIANVIDPNDNESGYISIQFNITSNKCILDNIESNRQEMNALFGMSPDPIVVLDRAQKVSHANLSFYALFNIVETNLIGIKEVDLDSLLKDLCINQYLATSSLPPSSDLTEGACIAFTQNELLTLELKLNNKVIARSFLDCKQPQISRVIYYRDITQETIVEKMKSEFVATAAHELRTPMTIIFGYAELLRLTPPNIDMQKYMIDVIHAQSKAMIELLNDILDVARIESQVENRYNLESQSIAPLLHEICETFITPENNNLVELKISQTLPNVNMDAPKIAQAIKNCLSNAYKFSPQNSIVQMQVTEVAQDDKFEILIYIQDYGIGMTPDQLERVFEKFYRADPTGIIPGTGLGMAIIKEIIEQHDGYIEVKSEYGVGTNVLIHLPVSDQQAN